MTNQTLPLFNTETRIQIAPDAFIFKHYLDEDACAELLKEIRFIMSISPFRFMRTKGNHKLSASQTSCGSYGWITDPIQGYRYSSMDPATGQPWPIMPKLFLSIAYDIAEKTGFPQFIPESCLINRYVPNTKMGLHQDIDEKNSFLPIVSISLGLPARFQFGGLNRGDPINKYLLEHGDIVVWGGKSRFCYHGILPIQEGNHFATGRNRFNLTFRKVLP